MSGARRFLEDWGSLLRCRRNLDLSACLCTRSTSEVASGSDRVSRVARRHGDMGVAAVCQAAGRIIRGA